MPWRLSLTDVLLTQIECARCGRCEARMLLVLVARENNSEKRTFECPRCDFIETKIVDDPLSSETVIRLTNCIKPSD